MRAQSIRTALERAGVADALCKKLLRYLYVLGCSSSLSHDIVQECLLTVLQRPFEHRSEQETLALLKKIARFKFLNVLRSRRGETSAPTEQFDAVVAEADAMWNDWALSDDLEALKTCLRGLPRQARDALTARHCDGLGVEAIAAQTGLQPGGVKTLLRRARQKVRECMHRRKAEHSQRGEVRDGG